MASVEREPPGTDGPEPGRKRQKVKVTESDTTHPPVLLNPADCDIGECQFLLRLSFFFYIAFIKALASAG